MLFSINGYWRDDKSPIVGYLVTDHHDIGEDDNIFFYGVSEDQLKQAIEDDENHGLGEFVVESYEIITK